MGFPALPGGLLGLSGAGVWRGGTYLFCLLPHAHEWFLLKDKCKRSLSISGIRLGEGCGKLLKS